MKSIILVLALFVSVTCAGQETISVEDLSPLFNKDWKGTLMYLDYSSNEEVTLRIEMTVEPKDSNSVVVHFKYPDEINANSTGVIEISGDGTKINGQKIESVEKIGGGNIELITSDFGDDDGKPATFTYTYIIGPSIYSNEKFVHYEGAERAFIRNRYTLRPAGQ